MNHWAMQYLSVFIRGMLMGAADIVPGVSGGTIAFITGIYERLLNALRAFTPAALLLWRQQGFGAFWRHVDGYFLVSLFGGALVSVFALAHSINRLMEAHPLVVWGFFFGLVVASGFLVLRDITSWSLPRFCMLALGIAFALLVAILKPVQVPINLITFFLAGMIAICAMILPGISGSFLLLMMGFYPSILQAIMNVDIVVLVTFASGCVLGLLAFSHLLSWFLRYYYYATLALLSGFLLGSLAIIWPWKEVVTTTLDRHGELQPLVQQNITPWQYQAGGGEAYIGSVLMACVGGLFLVIALDYVARLLKNQME